jgi:MFS family permease
MHFLIFVGCFLVGIQQGLGQFFRFTAVEIFPKHIQSKSVTVILSGGIIGALTGPFLARWSVDLFHTHFKYESCFFMLGMVGLFNLIVLFNVKFPSKSVAGYRSTRDIKCRPLLEIVSQPKLILSVAVATIANSVMVMLMSNCIMSMEDDGFRFQAISIALQIHFLGELRMYS